MGVIGIVAALIAGWSIVEHWVKDQSTLSWMANAWVLFLSSSLLVIFIVRHFQTLRKEKYANITPLLHQTIHCIRNAETFLVEQNPGPDASRAELEQHLLTVKTIFGNALDQVAGIYRSITATHCRACIKLFYSVGDELYVYTYLRDQTSHEKCLSMDNKRVEENHDNLEDNSSFAKLFSENDNVWHFASNNLLADRGFQTTSITAYQPDHGMRTDVLGWFSRAGAKSPLPYKSTLTCVIRQGAFTMMPKRGSEVVGFISVDSESRGVFVERWDVQMLFTVADALFRPICRVIAAQREAEAKGDS